MSFDDLIKEGIVKNEKGECYAEYNGIQSVMYCKGVKSERGLYRVWISNMQKMIRRGKLDEAITSMIECAESGDVFRNNVINRLIKVIVSEDIGLAYPTLPIFFAELVKRQKQLTDAELLQVVCVLVKSKKSRLIDNLYILCEKNIKYSFEESFSILKDSITNKQVLKAVSHLNNCIDKSKSVNWTISLYGGIKKKQQIYEVWEYIIKESGMVSRINIALLNIYMSHETNSGKKLNMIQAMLNLMFKSEIDFDSCLDMCKEEYKGEWKRDLSIWPSSISYDKHSLPNADRFGRGTEFFFRYGARLNNKSTNKWLMDMERKYLIE